MEIVPDKCICGLATAVTDLLQSVELQYHGYQGESKDTDNSKGPPKANVTNRLNGLFSLVHGLGGTAVVWTYIDQLAQVLSALVGWSRIETCGGKKSGSQCKGTDGNDNPHGQSGSGGGSTGCKYLDPVQENTPCTECKCMKWNVTYADDDKNGHHLGRGCQRCKDGSDHDCQCSTGGCSCTADKCKCALAGKCCKCCCKDKCGKCSDKCSCIEKEDRYRSAYSRGLKATYVEVSIENRPPLWSDLTTAYRGDTDKLTPSQRRHHCARILLGSVCLIWSGLTYMYWTGKYAKGSPRWNNHILDGSGLDDGTLSQWLQALGFPRDMLNNSGPQNRLDKVIWDGLSDMLLLGFAVPSGLIGSVAQDDYGNTARGPAGMNYPGLVHTIHRDSFNNDSAIVFKNGSASGTTERDQNKIGAFFKLYILSCAYFTGLQKKSTSHSTTPKNPNTIREILYWLSALPYSQAYKEMLTHAKKELDKASPKDKKLSFLQQGRPKPITVHEYNLFAHFQAVTQYCPLVLIGIQGGIHSTTDSTTPAIHSLYANTECSFTYPTVSIQAYNQVVHYIRGLFYQLYFLRKQCAVKVALGGKWRECRYGDGVLGKDVVSWMCLGCNPMEHDRKKRVGKVKDEILKGVKEWKDENQEVTEDSDCAKALKELLEAIGEVVVQLGNAQERLDRGKYDLEGVMKALNGVYSGTNGGNGFKDVLEKVLGKLETDKVGALEKVVTEKVNGLEEEVKRLEDLMKKVNGQELVGEAKTKLEKAKDALTMAKGKLGEAKKELGEAKGKFPGSSSDIDPCKNIVSASIDGLHKVLQLLKDAVKHIIEATKNDIRKLQDAIIEASDTADVVGEVDKHQAKQKVTLDAYSVLLTTIDQLISICNSPKCSACDQHSPKCGQQPQSKYCDKCHQQYMDGFPSPLQAFLEDRLPGFSCQEVPEDENPDYPPAASHLEHCGGSGQCCPLPMGFRGQFYSGIRDCTGKRLYGILYFFSNGDMMQSCVYTLVRVTAALSATTPQVLGDVFGFFRGGVGEKERGMTKKSGQKPCDHTGNPSQKGDGDYFCCWCASGLRDEVKKIEWIPKKDDDGGKYRESVGTALIDIKGDNGSAVALKSTTTTTTTSLSRLTQNCQYLSPLTGELYTAVSATFGRTYLSWVLYLSDALHSGLESLASEFQQIECRGCKGQCDPNKCTKGSHGQASGQCKCQSIVSCTGVLPVLYRHGLSYCDVEALHYSKGEFY